MNPSPPTPRRPARVVATTPLAALITLAALAVRFVVTPVPAAAAPGPVPSFQLPDQFGTRHRMEFPRPRPLLLLIGDRRGSEETDGWIAPDGRILAHITGPPDDRKLNTLRASLTPLLGSTNAPSAPRRSD